MDGFPFLPNSLPFLLKKYYFSSSRAVHIFSRCTVTAIDVCEMMILAWQRVLKMFCYAGCGDECVLCIIHLRLGSICFFDRFLVLTKAFIKSKYSKTVILCYLMLLYMFFSLIESTSHLFKVYWDSYRCMCEILFSACSLLRAVCVTWVVTMDDFFVLSGSSVCPESGETASRQRVYNRAVKR